MSVSLFVDKAGSQEMSVSLAQGAANLAADKVSPKEKEDQRTERVKSAQEMEVSEFLKDKSGRQMALDILKPFFSKLAQAGISAGKQNELNEEALKEIAVGRDSFEDKVDIKTTSSFIKQIRKPGQQGGGGSGSSSSGYSRDEVLALLKEYVSILTQFASSQSPALADKIKELREKLLSKGVAEAELKNIEIGIKEGKRTDVTEVVKEAIVLQLLSEDNQIEKAAYGRGIKDLLKNLDPQEAMEVVEKAKFKASQELKSFTMEELENALIKKTHLQDKNYSDIFKLIRVGEKVGTDCVNWMQEVWPNKKDDHGLYLMDVPHSATGVMVNTSTDNPDSRQPKHGYEYEKGDESEVLVNRLRALYMQRALKGDAFTYLKTEFKMRKLKNGLFKLGILTKELDEHIQHEAEIVAKVNIIEMLKEALIERATFYELAGPAHQLVERKIKGLLKNAERLGMPISTEEFNLMRDNANRRVFELSRRELDELRTQRKVKDSPKLEKKEKLLVRLLTRLKGESNIEEGIPENC